MSCRGRRPPRTATSSPSDYDYDAVRAGLTLEYSSDRVEGTVNKIKMLKRQMFGRANFDLLRTRVLHAH